MSYRFKYRGFDVECNTVQEVEALIGPFRPSPKPLRRTAHPHPSNAIVLWAIAKIMAPLAITDRANAIQTYLNEVAREAIPKNLGESLTAYRHLRQAGRQSKIRGLLKEKVEANATPL